MKMNLLNCVMPERSAINIAAILNANNMSFVQIPTISDRYRYNCWGFVSFVFGWEKEARWVSADQMEEHLTHNTRSIDESEATVGDIAVFRREVDEWGDWASKSDLSHTALVTPDLSVICHKPGSGALCIDTIEYAKMAYGKVSYVRPLTTQLK